MRTYTHAIVGYLIYLNSSYQEKKLAVLGAILPDIILAIGFIFHFGDFDLIRYLHDIFHFSGLHTITELMHSFLIVVPLLIGSYFFYRKAIPFFIGMLSHVFLDLLTHQKWAYNIIFPIPFPTLNGPFSYSSIWFTVVEHLFVLGFIVWFYMKYSKKSKKKSR